MSERHDRSGLRATTPTKGMVGLVSGPAREASESAVGHRLGNCFDVRVAHRCCSPPEYDADQPYCCKTRDGG